ncbi:hypothetical protein K435DRAFT_820010 [Dendrothele bispora CBS 962.96]|uniref:CxC1-like cysteine cluster associated with KDZ transposases domain-containing protein n=1 Tax=Dendrothele bispora (strain CBS 962.96) TaxID=1314807 RepID=A0A4S8LXY4_DENBC|nr:hypothetical protein K435DRAFT_820010 [Dendrothele bispora CBS 962.96]
MGGFRTRLRVPATQPSPVHHYSNANQFEVTETVVSSCRVRDEEKAPQVHLSHGRALIQDQTSFSNRENSFPDAEGLVGSGEPLYTSSKHAVKRQRLLERWQRIIPGLIEPYWETLHDTKNLHNTAQLQVMNNHCTCCQFPRELNIEIVRFNKYERITLWASDCKPAAQQLLRSGLFPCAPVYPTMAVDLRMLDFVTRLFLRVAPNHTAWCATVADYLRCQGYKLQGQVQGWDPLRCRFGNTLQWYNSLQAEAQVRLNSLLQHTRNQFREPSPSPNTEILDHRATVTEVEDEDYQRQRGPDYTSGPYDIELTEGDASTHRTARKRSHESDDNSEHPEEDVPLDRPSEYLRSRCPICFGGTFDRQNKQLTWSDVIVCLDANFTQRHQSERRDPARKHPDSFFLSDDEVQEVEARVESARAGRPTKKTKTGEEEQNEDDRMEPGMRVSKAVLDLCGETLAKVVSAGYDVTGLMALLCRHDRPLFVVNMSTPGERQHYAIALLEKLFQHLPSFVDVGLLYDIGCQLERSCFKWGFLEDDLERLTFAISVFHVFGHQWACQIIYNPRKCVGFGLSDGEGAGLWSSIQCLIAYTRVAGYHLRMYTLDSQLHFGNEENLLRMGTWILRKLRLSSEKRIENMKILEECESDLEFLRVQWQEQIRVQTQPLPCQSRNKGKRAVEECMQLRRGQKVLEKRMKLLEDIITNVNAASYEIAAAQLDLPKAVEDYNKATDKLRKKERALGAHEKTQLHRLINNSYVQKRMNALALKSRLRSRVQARKFELDRLERSYRRKRSDQHLKEHTADSVKRRDPDIQQLAQKYNKLVQEMRDLVMTKKAPRNAVVPEFIDTKKIFNVDVDDTIWQDTGLNGEDDGQAPPAWLADEKVRRGIQAMLEVDRCDEEDERLGVEMKSMKEWFSEEWRVLMDTIDTTENLATVYQLDLRHYSGHWEGEWGPSHEELADARSWEATGGLDVIEDEDHSQIEFEAEVDPELTEREEIIAMAEVYREDEGITIYY